jgi:hypothetical protein
MKMCVLALGQDMYWLDAVLEATATLADIAPVKKFFGVPLKSIPQLPPPKANTVLLVDASGQVDLPAVVSGFRSAGWRYVVVVAADPSAKEATAVLRRNLGYDYWQKTYDVDAIREKVLVCITEIMEKKHSRKSKPRTLFE